MRICHIIEYPGLGGTEHHALYLADSAIKSGHQISFILGGEGPASAILKKRNISYAVIPMKSSFNPFLVIGSVLRIREYVKRTKVDIVHTHMLREHSLAIGAKFLGSGSKVVRTFHRLDQFSRKMHPLLWLYRWQTDRVIAVSELMAKKITENKISKKPVVINNGVPKIAVKKHESAIGFLGRIAEEKGIFNFIKENKDLLQRQKLIVGGEGPDFPRIEKFIKEEGLEKNVTLKGNIIDRQDFFEAISVLIITSETESTLPLVGLEAFSAGVPIVTFDLPAVTEMVTKENAVTVQFGDFRMAAEEAIKLKTDPDRLARMGKCAEQLFEEKYTIEKMWEKTEVLYKGLIN